MILVRKMEREFIRSIWEFIKSAETNRAFLMTIFSDKYDLSPQHVRVLVQIALDNKVSLGNLAENLLMNEGNLSKLCKALESKDLIIRERSIEDNRILMISLSEKGRRLEATLQDDLSRIFGDFLNAYPEETLRSVIRFLSEYNSFMTKKQLEIIRLNQINDEEGKNG